MTGPRRRRRGIAPAPRRIEIRLTEEEHAAIHRAACARPGRPVSLARFVADAALAAADATPAPSPPRRAPSLTALAEVMDAVTAVNRVGNNLNQLAREKNVTGLRPVGTYAEVQRARAVLARLAEVAERAASGAA